jgi:hypothetical protein
MPVLPWAATETHPSVDHQEVAVGRSDDDGAALQRIALRCLAYRKARGTPEDRGQGAGTAWSQVQNDEDARGELGREPADEPSKRLHSARGCADGDHGGGGALRLRRHLVSVPVARALPYVEGQSAQCR